MAQDYRARLRIRHSADLLRLRFERNAEVRLFFRAHPDVADCFHVLILSKPPIDVKESFTHDLNPVKIRSWRRDYHPRFGSISRSKEPKAERSGGNDPSKR